MTEKINMFMFLVFAFKSCSAAEYIPLHRYNSSVMFQVGAQFPASTGFDVALYSESLANLTRLTVCSSPVYISIDWGRPDKYLFVSRCALAEIEMYIYTYGKVSNMTPVERSDSKALITMVINTDYPLSHSVAGKISYENMKILLDPVVANITLTQPVLLPEPGDLNSKTTYVTSPLITSFHPPASVHSTPIITISTPISTPISTLIATPIPNGMQTSNDSGTVVVVAWLLVICAVTASNFSLFRTHNNYRLVIKPIRNHSG